MMSEEVAAGLRKARESIAAAHLLLEGGFPGFAASRAYYTMFYCAEALLLHRGMTFASHGAVIGAFGKEFAKTRELDPQLHRHLIDAFGRRQRADYDHLAEIHVRDAREQIRRAEEFLSVVESYLREHAAE